MTQFIKTGKEEDAHGRKRLLGFVALTDKTREQDILKIGVPVTFRQFFLGMNTGS